MKNFSKFALLGAALAFSAAAHATIVTANDASSQSLANMTAAAVSTYESGATFVTSTSGLYNAAPNYTGSYSESIYKGESATQNPGGTACASCLAFVYTFNVATNKANDGVETWALSDMYQGGLVSNNIFDVDGTTLAVVSTSGVTIQLGGIGAETAGTTETIIDFTNAVGTTPGFATAQDGQVVQDADIAPSQTPEPSSLMLLGSGLLSAGGMIMRRRKLVA